MGFRHDVRIYLGGRITETPKIRVPLAEGELLAEEIAIELAPLSEYLIIAGSIRRRRPEVGDIEIVVLPKDLNMFRHALDQKGFHGGKRIMKKLVNGLPVEIYIAHKPEELGALTFSATGDRLWNVAMRKKAMSKGWTLNQYGLWDAKTLRPVLQSIYEGDFFQALGIDWHEPEERSLLHRPKGYKRHAMAGTMAGPKDWSPIGSLPPGFLEEWQAAYDEESAGSAVVKQVFLKADEDSIRLWLALERQDTGIEYYLISFKDAPSDDELAHAAEEPSEVLIEMSEDVSYGHGLNWDGPHERPF